MEHIIKKGIYGIEFEKIIEGVNYIDPKTGNIETSIVEFRRDPLTDLWVRINVSRHNRPKEKYEVNIKRKNCIFCKDFVFLETPNFMDNQKYIKGNSILFPNKYPFSKKHAILVPNYNEHIESFSELDFLDFYNSMILASDYLKESYNFDKNTKYIFININKGHLAGASIAHLHFQLIQDDKPTNYIKFFIERSKGYFKEYRRFLIEDLALSEEKVGERFIKKDRIIWWFSSFAPFKDNEVIGYVNSFNIINMAEINFKEFVKELYEFIVKYEKLFGDFNLLIFDPAFIKDPGLRPFIKIVSRNPSDTGFMEILHLEPVSTTLPEETAKMLRD